MERQPIVLTRPRHRHPGRQPCRRQQGMVLIYALIVLVAMMLAGVALVRSVNTGSQIAGNVGFRQDAVATADRATQMAIDLLYDKLEALPESLDADIPSIGYYASVDDDLDPTGNGLAANTRKLIDWGDVAGSGDDFCKAFPDSSYATCAYTPNAGADGKGVVVVNGNAASYIVFRMCDVAGSHASGVAKCATQTTAAVNECQGAINYENEGHCATGGASTPLYRILVRTVGARNTVSYTETVVHF